MKNHGRYLSIFLFFVSGITISSAQDLDVFTDFPVAFSGKVIGHVNALDHIGNRTDGTKSGSQTIYYISQEMKKAGLEVTLDTFSFVTFQRKKQKLSIYGKKYEPRQVILNPYHGPVSYTGKFTFFYPDSSLNLQMMKDFSGKIVVTCPPATLIRLATRSPLAILVLSKKDFDQVVAESRKTIPSGKILSFQFSGKTRKIYSANVVGTVKPENPDSSEVIIASHWDSFNSRGVNDNASGVGTLLGLADYFQFHRASFRTTIRFIAFGARETGMNGSLAYIDHHPKELKNCKLMFNIDGVNGIHVISVDMTGGVSGISRVKGVIKENIYFRKNALRENGDKWLWLDDYPMASNVPIPLRDDILAVCNRLSLKIEQVEGLGSDHQAFSLAGIPSTGISTENDNSGKVSGVAVKKVYPEGMWLAGRIVAGVVARYLAPVIR